MSPQKLRREVALKLMPEPLAADRFWFPARDKRYIPRLRLFDVPVPPIYVPSAVESPFK